MKSSSKQMNLVLTVFVGLFLQYIPQQAYAQLIKRTFSQEKLSARIKQLAEITDKTITFDASQVGNIVVPALAANNYTLEQLLTGSLHTTGYTFRYINNSYVIFRKKVDEDKDRKKKSTGTGNLSGFILDQKGEPLVGATVRIPNTSFGTVTNAQGKYSLKSVPAGTVTIEVSYISFQTQKITEVKINPAKTTELDLVMKEANEELGEVVVTAEYSEASAKGLYAKQKAMTAMSDGVSADLIKKTSDSNVAQVLKRVSGVNIQDNKYVTVRGMSERYNNVQLNGTVLPSTEPNRRNFAFDIIPSNLVENVTILKTFTPDMQGEFTGGMVNVSTLSIPKERLLSLSVGSGFNTNSTGKTFMSGKRFKSDYFLGNSSERDWFGRDWVNDTYAGYWNNGLLKPEDAEKAYAMNAKIPNHWGLSKYTAAPTQNYALSIGTPFDLGDHNTLGVVVAATYRHEENTETVLEANYRKTGQKAMDAHNYKFATAIGALANVGWERPGHKITLSNMFNNRFTQSSMDRMVEDKGSSRLFLEHYSSPLRNILWQSRLEGEHKLFNDKLIFSWFGDYNKLTRESHDDRLMQGDVDYTINKDGSYEPTLLSNGRPAVNWISRLALGAADLSGGFIMYSDLSETKKNVGGNFTVPFLVAGNKQSLKAGYWGTFRNADYHQQYLTSKYGPNSTYSMFNGLTLPEVYSSDNFAKGYLIYELAGKKGDKVDYYRGDQKIHAAYLMGEFTFLKRVHVTGGVRMENTKMNVSTYYNKSTAVDSAVVRNYTDYLPAATVVWNITSSLNLRAAYGKTLARPDFRELTPFRYYNVNDRLIVSGITPLKTTYTSNVDLRLEWYPSAGEIVSVSAFYKKFKDPVELLSSDPQTSGNFILSSYNLDKSTMKGLELNLRKSLAFIAPVAFLRDLYLNANATILKGDVSYNLAYLRNVASGLSTDELDNFASNRKRPLQGMAPYMVNAGLTYSGKLLGAAVSYATTGRKLVQAAPKEWNDEYEAPRHVLDLQLSVRPWRNLEIKANASDILNQASIIYINSGDYGEDNYDMGYNKDRDVIRSKIKRGTSYSFSVSYNF